MVFDGNDRDLKVDPVDDPIVATAGAVKPFKFEAKGLADTLRPEDWEAKVAFGDVTHFSGSPGVRQVMGVRKFIWGIGVAITALLLTAVPVYAEEGRGLLLESTTATLGSPFTVAGDGCEQDWVEVGLSMSSRTVATAADGTWSADLLVSPPEDGQSTATLYASCGQGPDRWGYAKATITVTTGDGSTPELQPRLWLSSDLVSVGYFLRVSGNGCPAGVKVQVAEQVRPAQHDGGYWASLLIVSEGVDGEVPVTATCADGSVEYPATTVTVVADGHHGIPMLPETGQEPSPSPDPTQEPAPSTPGNTPGPPSTGV